MRALIVIVVLGLAVLPQRPGFLAVVDKAVFSFGSSMLKTEDASFPVSVLRLPNNELQGWLQEPISRPDLLQWLSQRLAERSQVVIFPEGAEIASYSAVKNYLQQLPALSSQPALQNLMAEMQLWDKLQHSRQVFFVRRQGCSSVLKDKPVSVLRDPQWADMLLLESDLPSWFCQGRIQQPLLVKDNQGINASFMSALYVRWQGQEVLRSRGDGTLGLGEKKIALSPDGSVIPLQGPAVNTYSLDDLTTSRPWPRRQLWLLTEAGNSEYQQLVSVLRSLNDHSYLSSPNYHPALERGLLVLALVYLLWLLPRLGLASGLLASGVVSVLLVGSQLLVMLGPRQWLPLGLVVEVLVIGNLLLLPILWREAKHKQQHALAQSDRLKLASLYLKHDQLDDSYHCLQRCRPSQERWDTFYTLAQAYERRREYQRALEIYQQIQKRHKRFKDVAEKISSLTSRQGSSTVLGADKTLVLTHAHVSKPVLGRYEIERELGRGAMGIVYLARDPRISRQVAIKTLEYGRIEPAKLESFKTRFFREAEAVGRLTHPDIVTIYDIGEEKDLAFIAMDYIPGKPLSDFVQPAKLLKPKEVYQLCARVAEALHYAHGKNIVHRDVKPANIMYDPASGKVTVTDFGIARLTDDSRTRTGDVFGSPLYMSPEQLRGEKSTAQTDIYGLGVTFYQLLSGALPFNGDTLANLTYEVIHKKHKPIRSLRPKLPASATRIVNKALQKVAKKRYPDAAAMAEVLRSSLQKDFR